MAGYGKVDYDTVYAHIEEWLGKGDHTQIYAMVIDLIYKLEKGKFYNFK